MITVQQLPVITTSLNDVMNDNHIINGLFTSPMAGPKIIIEGSLNPPMTMDCYLSFITVLGIVTPSQSS